MENFGNNKPVNSEHGKAENVGKPTASADKRSAKGKVENNRGDYGYGGGYSGYGGYGYGGYGGYGNYGYGGYGGYGNYGYGGYYGSYGSKNYSSDAGVPNRTMHDYLMILRERFWYIVVTFFIIFAGVLLYTFRITPIYTSVATVQILRDTDTPIDGPGSAERSRNAVIGNIEDFNTQVKLIESFEVIRAVKSRLKEDEIKRFMAPYHDMFTFGIRKTEEELLAENRNILPERMSLIVRIMFSHPDNAMAARIANLFASEYISYTHQTRVQKLMDSIDELRTKVAQQDAKVRDLDAKLVEYRKQNGAVSLDKVDDVDRTELQDLNSILTNDKRVYDAVAVQWEMLQEYKRDNKDMCDLHFIAELPQISKLLTDRSTQQVYIAQLEKRYKEKHPRMIEARRALDQIEKELKSAVDSAYFKTQANYENARQNYEQSQKRLAEKKKAVLELGEKSIAYKSLERERLVADGMHASLIASMNVRTAQVSLINEGAIIVDRATPSIRPSSPNYVLNIIVGILAGCIGGVGMALLVAFLDDRAKSAYDVEAIIGLPLLGVIPRIKRLNSSEKAQVAASNADRITTEAFRSLYSTIKVNNLSKAAKVILFTSTTPSEGKSFVVTNLAFTCALNGERVLIIDADLRLPAMAKVLGITPKEGEGVIGHISEGIPFDKAVIKDYFPNLDVLVCEKRAKNPSQTLNSPEFIAMLAKARESYDRIFIDSPPIGAVSDAMVLLPSVDGVLYIIKFNSVKRKTVRGYVRRMMDSNVPVLGAVMNMTNPRSVTDSVNYYDKSYQNYYTVPPDVDEAGAGGDGLPPDESVVDDNAPKS